MRKHCGRKDEFRIGLESLYKKCGSSGPLRKMRENVRKMIASDHLPDFAVELTTDDIVVFRQREKWWEKDGAPSPPTGFPYTVGTETFALAKQYTGREDVYTWFEDWKEHWAQNGREVLLSPDKAFLGFCKGRAQSKQRRGW